MCSRTSSAWRANTRSRNGLGRAPVQSCQMWHLLRPNSRASWATNVTRAFWLKRIGVSVIIQRDGEQKMFSCQARCFSASVLLPLSVPRQTDIPPREKEIGKRIRLLRSALNLTQTEFGRRAAIERGALAKYELGLTPLPWRSAEFLCKSFHLNATWLATGEGPTEPYSPPPTLPSGSALEGKLFSDVFERYFASHVIKSTVKKKNAISGSRIGFHVTPSRTNTSYEAFRALLAEFDSRFLEMKHIKDRRAFAKALVGVHDRFFIKMYRDKTIPSLVLVETRDL